MLRCDAIHPGVPLSFHEVRSRIIEHLTDQRRQICQRGRIQSLLTT